MSKKTILITGATGNISGSLVVPGFNNFMIIMQIIHIPSGR